MSKHMRSSLGNRLQRIRQKAIDNGMELLSEDEVLEEVRRRRAGEDENLWKERCEKLMDAVALCIAVKEHFGGLDAMGPSLDNLRSVFFRVRDEL